MLYLGMNVFKIYFIEMVLNGELFNILGNVSVLNILVLFFLGCNWWFLEWDSKKFKISKGIFYDLNYLYVFFKFVVLRNLLYRYWSYYISLKDFIFILWFIFIW